MSDETKIPNEDALWDILSNPPTEPEEKKTAPAESKETTKKQEKPEQTAPVQKSGRKIDGFFLGCMAGVAAVSVAVTLAVSSVVGGSSAGTVGPAVPGETGENTELLELQQENEQLRTQVKLQQKTILDLQSSLMDIMGTEEFLENMETTPDSSNEILEKQTEAYELLVQIQNAYADFDREKLEELIPEMDTMLQYLSQDALNSYYLILEYMEQPSLG